MKLSDSDVGRFLAYVDVREDDECWPWLSAEIEGYGILRVSGRNVRATHIALWLAKGELSNGRSALHKCDNPICCNPSHLWFGTTAENLADMRRKGRQPVFSDERRKSVSDRMRAVPKSAEHRAKIGEGNKRRKALYQRVVKQFAFNYLGV